MNTFEDGWKDRDGTAFFVQGWEPGTGEPRALIALVHGLGEHTGRYVHVAEALTDAGYAMAGFDLRGHGRSGGARGHSPSLDAYMKDIRQFFELMAQRYPDISHFLYGHSLGGLLALAYTIQYGAGLRGAVITGAGLRSALQEQRAKIALVRLLGSVLPTLTVPSGLDPAILSRDPAVVQAYRDDPLVHFQTSLGFGKAGLQAIDLCFARAREFPVPLLIMHGKEDQLTYPGGSTDFAELVGAVGGDVTLRVWEGLSHEIHNEPEKADVFRYMIEWLNRHL